MKDLTFKPIGYVKNKRAEKSDKFWGTVESIIELTEEFSVDSLDGIESFSHLEILYSFHKSEKVFVGSEHPRGDKRYPKVGIFAQRKKDRPNHIGATIVNLIRTEEKSLIVSNLDAINGTPILDIKPVFQEYMPKGEIKQPDWTKELMKEYW
ncbi:MAG: tRNA (N6-threonylcarbamoyladenosine(37)-N6)-methyltransferase TrmO [Reichenbachiella sp.]|uniref:tRNA (N6-threonylcarbamoyladenosine(37)-N6)-methyltransferase TrmO n=1 Tax=Reichenbachiella sp. TaxID=2184521 RepID=UPI00296779BF|nr:tRNA (N6-threonylcarbamoyladenosine(37)-N6)-methyltransferase TrmO [Reichenbachiella sp.]MDW3209093.1 tRNA (N6-threonylcarbamoyladenosine(37)-N6)-methyltransferase TrmO [Reichenbachiella sp.]